LTFGLVHGHNEQVIFTTTMTAIIDQGAYGPSAFIRTEYNTQIVMSGSAPCVEWSFRIKELENWLITLEEAMVDKNNYGHRRGLEDIYFSLKAAHKKHQAQHEAIVTDAPTADDLQAYLAAYAAAVGGQGS
jgi:hypothetical protein